MLRWAKNLSKFGSVASEEKSSEILNNFPIQILCGSCKCIGKHTWPCRISQMSTYDNLFSNFGRSPVPDDLCTDSAPRHPRFCRRFLKGFTIYGHGGHLGQWATTILATFHFPDQIRLNLKLEQIWLSGFRGEVLWNSQQFSYLNVWGSWEANLTLP